MNENQEKTALALKKAGYAPDFASRVATRIDGAEHKRLQKLEPAELREEIDAIERQRYEARAVIARSLAITTGRAQELVYLLNADEVDRVLAARRPEQVKDVLNANHDRRHADVQHAPPEPKKKAADEDPAKGQKKASRKKADK